MFRSNRYAMQVVIISVNFQGGGLVYSLNSIVYLTGIGDPILSLC